MIAVISMHDDKKDGTHVTCVINAAGNVIVSEMEGILSSMYKQQPNEFILALDDMMERLNAKNNSCN